MIVNNNFGLIITKGLGGPACCAMITAPFGLVCGCQVTPVGPSGTGGGSPVYLTPMAIPLSQRLDMNNRLVIITIAHKDKLKWRKEYTVDKKKAAILIEIFNFVNVVKDRTTIAVDNLKQVTLKVIAKFTTKYPDDKEQ